MTGRLPPAARRGRVWPHQPHGLPRPPLGHARLLLHPPGRLARRPM